VCTAFNTGYEVSNGGVGIEVLKLTLADEKPLFHIWERELKREGGREGGREREREREKERERARKRER
jgi:hypothetical protein